MNNYLDETKYVRCSIVTKNLFHRFYDKFYDHGLRKIYTRIRVAHDYISNHIIDQFREGNKIIFIHEQFECCVIDKDFDILYPINSDNIEYYNNLSPNDKGIAVYFGFNVTNKDHAQFMTVTQFELAMNISNTFEEFIAIFEQIDTKPIFM